MLEHPLRVDRKWRLAGRWLLALCVLLIFDFALAQVAKELLPSPSRLAEKEREHRTRSQIYHHDLRKMMKSTSHWGDRKVSFFTNSLGFRDRSARTVPQQSELHRLIFIGDSFTEGVGIEYDDTFAGIVDGKLATCSIEILNAAVVSYSPSIYYRKLRYLIEEVELEFDETVVFLDISDIEDEAVLYDIDSNDNVVDSPLSPVKGVFTPTQRALEEEAIPLKVRLIENSVLLRVVDVIGQRIASRRSETRAQTPTVPASIGLARSSWTFNDHLYRVYGRKGLEQAERAMDLLLAQLRSYGADLTLVVYPWPDQIAARDIESKQVTWWRRWAENNDVEFIDLFPLFVGTGDPNEIIGRYFIPGDVHVNEAGHRLIAEEFLRNRGDLTSRCE